MGQNKPIELIRLYINSLQGFWGSFSQKMNAHKGDLSRIRVPADNLALKTSGLGASQRWGARADWRNVGRPETIPAHGTWEGCTTGEQVLAGAFSCLRDAKMARCLREEGLSNDRVQPEDGRELQGF